jgi:hypothetical protein
MGVYFTKNAVINANEGRGNREQGRGKSMIYYAVMTRKTYIM